MDDSELPSCVTTSRDNQWWFSRTELADFVRAGQTICLRIANRDCSMTRARPGSDGRPTLSYTFDAVADRDYWKSLGPEPVLLVLVSVDGNRPLRPEATTEPRRGRSAKAARLQRKQPVEDTKNQQSDLFLPARWEAPISCKQVLCIGLDLAWFGGSANNRASQYDTLAMVTIDRERRTFGEFSYRRVRLNDRPAEVDDEYANCDPDAELLSAAIQELVNGRQDGTQGVLLCIDAPLVANSQPGVWRLKETKAGVQRRACENALGKGCRGYGANWTPRIQPGSPLCKRVAKLMAMLCEIDFTIFPSQSSKVVFECYPAEAIWAGFVNGVTSKYHAYLRQGIALSDAGAVQSYKRSKSQRLAFQQYARFVADALTVVDSSTGLAAKHWNQLISEVIRKLSGDEDYVDSHTGFGRGGKLLDDVVDATFSLSAAIAFALDNAHVWMVDQGQDGHIIGPGRKTK